MTSGPGDTDRLLPYVPSLLSRWTPSGEDARHMRVDGSLAFVDISGFTRLTERLAAHGRVGAEQMSDLLSETFTGLLTETRDDGADLVKWGGDAMLLLFEGPGHASRAARAAHRMRTLLVDIGRIHLSSGTIRLRMSVGVHSGEFDFFLVGDPEIHLELVISGPGASTTALMEGAASAGQIGLSPTTAALLDPRLLGPPLLDGRLLRSAPTRADPHATPRRQRGEARPAVVLPPPIRGHLLQGAVEPEHRLITVAFVEFSGTDALLVAEGPTALAAALDEVVRNLQAACADHDVTFFESDINADGGKVMLTAGAPSSSDHDEERMLRVARVVVDRAGVLPLRIGINRGHVFAGDFGPSFRRTYSVKGDAINLAARVMGKARPGQVLATTEVVDRSQTVFRTTELPPFLVKGKAREVRAVEVGDLVGSRGVDRLRAPMVGRGTEMRLLATAMSEARSGVGTLVQVVGEAGIGKSRLVTELVDASRDVRVVTARCDQYASSTAYFPFRRLLREILDVSLEATSEEVAALMGDRLPATVPHLAAWLPLLAVPMDISLPQTQETREIDGRFRKARLEEVVVEVLAAVLDGPTILVLEDAHLMDDASADLVNRLALVAVDHPWLVLVTRQDQQHGFRPDEGGRCTTVRPRPLDAGEAIELAQVSAGEVALTPTALQSLAERSGGNPLFLEALVLEASRGGSVGQLPESVEGLVTSQLDRLERADKLALRYAAVLGTEVDEGVLDGLLDEHGGHLPSGALARLADFLVRDGGGQLRFRNALLRDVAYSGLPYSRRRILHDQVGRAIEAASAEPEDQSELLSLHYFHAGRHELAWRFSVLAGERALSKFAHPEAVEFFERAAESALPSMDLDPLAVARVYELLADSRFLVGLPQPAEEAYASARRRLRGDPVRLAGIIEKEARIDHRHRKFTQAMRRISRGLRALDGVTGPAADVARSLLMRRYAYSRFSQGRIDEALAWAETARAAAEKAADTDALAQADEMINAIYAGSGREEPLPHGELALAAYTDLGNLPRQGHCLNNLAVQAFTAGRWNQALASYVRARDLFRRIGDTAAEGNAIYNQAELLVCQRRYVEAATVLPSVLRIARAVQDEELVALALREQARTTAAADDLEGALAVLADARSRFEALGESTEVRATDVVLAELLLDAGRSSEAGALLSTIIADGDDVPSPGLHRLTARQLLAEDRVDQAMTMLDKGLELAAHDVNRYEEGLLLLEVAAAQRRTGGSNGPAALAAREILDRMGVRVG